MHDQSLKNEITLISTDGYVQHGLRSISAVLKKEGYKVNVIFLRHELDGKAIFNSPSIIKSIRDIVKDSMLVGISTNIQVNSPLAIWLLSNFRDMNLLSIWGGIYPTINPDECIKHADIICRGEGEYAVLELITKLKTGEPIDNIPNLWVKAKGHINKNEPRSLIADLDNLPFPDIDIEDHYHLDNNEGVVKKIADRNLMRSEMGDTFCIHSTRGCPLICSYCSNKAIDTLYGGQFRRTRKRSIEKVIEELQMVVEKVNPRIIWFSDDIFTIRSEAELELFSNLYKQHINLPFMCYVSPATVTEPEMKHLVAAGIKWLEMGIQSGSDYINREIYERHQTQKAVLKAAHIINNFKDKVIPAYQFILFNEYEREEDIIDTIRLIKLIPPPYTMQSFTLSLFKGSELYNRYVRDGYVAPDYKILTYTEADAAFRIGIKQMPNRKHYLYILLWFMIQSTRWGNKIMAVFKTDAWINIRRVPTVFCYVSSFVVTIICRAVLLTRRLIPSAGIRVMVLTD